MKEAPLARESEKSYFFTCPACNNEIRRTKNARKVPRYQAFINCPHCEERVKIKFPERDGYNKKDICPICNVNEKMKRASACIKCFRKNPKKYRSFEGSGRRKKYYDEEY